MADVNLSQSWTLPQTMAAIRSMLGAMDQQKSRLLRGQIVDYIHLGVQFVRNVARDQIKDFYQRELTVTLSAAVDISAIKIYDFKTARLIGSGNKTIDIVPYSVFQHMRAFHVFPTGEFVATPVSQGADDSRKLVLAVVGDGTPSGSATLQFERNCKKITAKADYMDIPDILMPHVIDYAALHAARQLSHQAPALVEAASRMADFVKTNRPEPQAEGVQA